MSDIKIAPTSQAQLDAVLQQARATFQTHRTRFPKSFPETTLCKLEERHRDAVDLAGDQPTSFSAIHNGMHVGYVLLRQKENAAMIYDIGVFPDARRQNIGRALLHRSVRIARERNWSTLFASVWTGNDASHRLFQSVGFQMQKPLLGKLATLFPKARVTIYRCDPTDIT